MGFSEIIMENIISNEPVTEYGTWILYHGTSRDNARKILKNGFNNPSYFTRDMGFAKQFGQVVFEIEIKTVYFNRINIMGEKGDDEIALSNISIDRIKSIHFYDHEPRYHNRIDYIKKKVEKENCNHEFVFKFVHETGGKHYQCKCGKIKHDLSKIEKNMGLKDLGCYYLMKRIERNYGKCSNAHVELDYYKNQYKDNPIQYPYSWLKPVFCECGKGYRPISV